MIRSTALLLTVLTGFSGLAYQITWQKYLATLLGSHSEATSAVLGIFLGGLSVGYWLFGRLTLWLGARAAASGRPPPLLVAYGVLEAGIGVWALLFPLLFRGVHAVSYALPHGSEAVGFTVDVALAALLIGPPTVLMGGTIPILTQALSRTLDEATRFHALVYAFNTVGAFAGALAAGFVLVPQLGLVRVMLAMGAVNLFAGAVFVALGMRRGGAAPVAPTHAAASFDGFSVYAAVATLVGFSMMVIQTGVIRVAALSFGASQFTFSMVVAIFVLCIALGSFIVSLVPAVRARHVVANQWGLAAFALALGVALPSTPYYAYLLRTPFANTELAFYLFQLQIFLMLGALCAPAIICSGATLPLLFHQMRREVGDLGNVAGALYSWNTVGSLLGALLGGYALLYWMDLREVYGLAAGSLLLAALLLTSRVYDLRRGVAVALTPVLLLAGLIGSWDPKLLSLGLFRDPPPQKDGLVGKREFLRKHVVYRDPLIFYDDDPTNNVSVWVHRFGDLESLSLRVNGKSDGNTLSDFTTMAMAAIVPALFVEDPKRAFVIGLGTGVTAGELAELDSIEKVRVAEISHGVIRALPLFDFANRGASRSHKIEIERSDAYRALARATGTFDLIVSEPSNPWVAGVENLYSREFLTAARARLTPHGVFAQWIHSYELDEATLALVLRTYAEVFENVAVWYMQGTDLLLLGFESRTAARDHYRLEQRASLPEFRGALRRLGVESFPALLAHELLPLDVVHAAIGEGPTQSLYHPRLGYLAARAFFLRGDTALPFTGSARAAELGTRNSLLRLYADRFGGRLPELALEQVAGETCKHMPSICVTILAYAQREAPASTRIASLVDELEARRVLDRDNLPIVSGFLGSDALPDTRPLSVERARELGALFQRHYHHAAPFRPDALLEMWQRCRVMPPTPKQCAEAAAAQSSAGALDAIARKDWLARCSATLQISRECQEGFDAAREMLEGPAHPVAERLETK
jgi:spermidine synthase